MARDPGRPWPSDRLADLWPHASRLRSAFPIHKAPVMEESLMTFDRAWVLIFALAPLGWMVFEWQRTRRHLALALKGLGLLAIVLALSEPRLTVSETKLAVGVLVDTSASVSQQDLARASQLAANLEKQRGRHWMRVLPFARSIREVAS